MDSKNTNKDTDINLNVTIEYAGTSACRIWYDTTAGSDRELDDGPGLSLRFHGLWSQICAAHAAEPEVGTHAFSRVTAVVTADDAMQPSAHTTTELDGISAPNGLRPCLLLLEWTLFCEEVLEHAAKRFDCDEGDLSIEQIREHMSQTWGCSDETEVESILRRDRTEQLEAVASRLDASALGKVLATAQAALSTQMLAVS